MHIDEQGPGFLSIVMPHPGLAGMYKTKPASRDEMQCFCEHDTIKLEGMKQSFDSSHDGRSITETMPTWYLNG